MIDLNHKYALLENGEVKALWYYFGNGYMEQRDVEEENGEYYLNYDEWEGGENSEGSWFSVARVHSKIIKTANNKWTLVKAKREIDK